MIKKKRRKKRRMSKAEPEEFGYEELSWEVWNNLLLVQQCPNCEGKIDRLPHPTIPKRAHLGCKKCHIYLLPPPKDQTEQRQEQSVRDREKQAELSGGSLYNPLELHYFCPNCYTDAIKKIQGKNKFEIKADLPPTLPDGTEGLAHTLVQQRMFSTNDSTESFPFECICGLRYYVEMRLFSREPEMHRLLGVELGFHSQCVNCKLGWNKAVGTNHFQFRCDLNLNCPLVRHMRARFYTIKEDEHDDRQLV